MGSVEHEINETAAEEKAEHRKARHPYFSEGELEAAKNFEHVRKKTV